ncbi:hypothetical protein C8Q78DRAFT_25825 [Trametes maxima]|nr:hypothetical protein C8Q78DRAFT_25825 [Trametes maxima]
MGSLTSGCLFSRDGNPARPGWRARFAHHLRYLHSCLRAEWSDRNPSVMSADPGVELPPLRTSLRPRTASAGPLLAPATLHHRLDTLCYCLTVLRSIELADGVTVARVQIGLDCSPISGDRAHSLVICLIWATRIAAFAAPRVPATFGAQATTGSRLFESTKNYDCVLGVTGRVAAAVDRKGEGRACFLSRARNIHRGLGEYASRPFVIQRSNWPLPVPYGPGVTVYVPTFRSSRCY